MRRRLKEQTGKLFVIKDRPQSIALAAAIGFFLGFTPLFGMKTLLALLLATLLRVNKIAALVAVSLHDLMLPLWPVVLRVEFGIGYWLLHQPHQWPPRIDLHHADLRQWFQWQKFASVGVPTLLGSIILGGPISLTLYLLLKRSLTRRQQQSESIAS